MPAASPRPSRDRKRTQLVPRLLDARAAVLEPTVRLPHVVDKGRSTVRRASPTRRIKGTILPLILLLSHKRTEGSDQLGASGQASTAPGLQGEVSWTTG